MSDIIANPPSFELAQKLVSDAPKPKRFPTTTHVRCALQAAILIREHYQTLCAHYLGGKETGSAQADAYFFATKLVEWESAAERFDLANALKADKIRLVDIVKRITPELRKLGMEVERNVITGTRLSAPLELTAEDEAA